jgi:hypothetical protein
MLADQVADLGLCGKEEVSVYRTGSMIPLAQQVAYLLAGVIEDKGNGRARENLDRIAARADKPSCSVDAGDVSGRCGVHVFRFLSCVPTTGQLYIMF